MAGTNDVKNNVSVEDFSIAYSQLITKARLLSQNIVLIKIPRFPKGIAYPYTYDMNETVNKYNETLEMLANKNFIRIFKFELREEWLCDGVHLNEVGSKNIGLQLADYVLKDKGIGERCE